MISMADYSHEIFKILSKKHLINEIEFFFFWKKKINWQKFFCGGCWFVRGGRDWCSFGCDWCASRIRTLRWGFGQGENPAEVCPIHPVGLARDPPSGLRTRAVCVCATPDDNDTLAAVLTNSHVSRSWDVRSKSSCGMGQWEEGGGCALRLPAAPLPAPIGHRYTNSGLNFHQRVPSKYHCSPFVCSPYGEKVASTAHYTSRPSSGPTAIYIPRSRCGTVTRQNDARYVLAITPRRPFIRPNASRRCLYRFLVRPPKPHERIVFSLIENQRVSQVSYYRFPGGWVFTGTAWYEPYYFGMG